MKKVSTALLGQAPIKLDDVAKRVLGELVEWFQRPFSAKPQSNTCNALVELDDAVLVSTALLGQAPIKLLPS